MAAEIIEVDVSEISSDKWLADLGTNWHICYDKRTSWNVRKLDVPVILGQLVGEVAMIRCGGTLKKKGSAIGTVVKGAEMHLKKDISGCEEGERKESRPTENETTLSCEAPCSVLTLSSDKQRRGGGSPWKDSLKGMWGSMVKWLKARDGGWKRTLASVNRSVHGIQ